ncbi:MAG TPA: PAAR-like protein [Thermoanaerobaculia bacterium]|nr:PAAR-like protein [Thermoanaerobaculia bacterium]
MPGFLFHVGAQAICPHGGQVTTTSSNTRVMVSNQAVATSADVSTIAGCPFTTPVPKPQPCIKVQWLTPATRVMINHQPALLQTSSALCQSAEQIPQGPPTVISGQMRVKGT